MKTNLLLRPLALVRRGVRTYMVACREHDANPRTYALHRIVDATDTVVDIAAPKIFDLADHLKQGIAQPVFTDSTVRYGDSIELRLWVHTDTSWITETPLAKDQIIEPSADGHLNLRATVHLTEQLIHWILSMAYHVRVIEPAFIAERIRDDVRKMQALYDSEPD